MSSNVARSSLLKQTAKAVLRVVTPSFYSARPIQTWPAWMGRVHDLKLPKAVVPQPSPAPTGAANINIIFRLVDCTRSLSGDIAECGVHRGASIIPIAIYLRQNGISKTVYGFDSFQGFDRSIDYDLGLHGAENADKVLGAFSNTSVRLVLNKAEGLGVDSINFEDSFSQFPKNVQFCFVHLDVNLYSSYKPCMEFFYPRMVKGGVILLDEYNDPPWPGCNLALDEFLADKPEQLQEAVSENYIKYYMVKAD
jgi:O-methyltransferase